MTARRGIRAASGPPPREPDRRGAAAGGSAPAAGSALRAWFDPHVLILLALPVLVHAPELLGIVSSDPNRLFFGLSDPVRQWTQGGLLPGMPGWIDGCAGVIVEALGRLVARDWLHGIVPWWNPYNGVGMPLAGEYQPAAFFLPFVLLTALPNGLLLMKLALQIVAGLSMRALLREMGLHPLVALVGGIGWAFNGTFAWASDGPTEPLAFLPMALFGIERMRGRTRPGGWGWLALGIGWMLLAGFPETTFLLGLVALGWAGLRIAQERGGRLVLAAGIGCGGIAALLLAAPQLLAFLSYLPHAFIGGHAGANDTPLPPPAWIMLLLPTVNGPIFFGSQDVWWSMGGFYGVMPVWLAILSLLSPGRRGLRAFLGAVMLLVCCKQAALPGITALMDLVPEMRNIFFFRYSPPVACFALLVLASLALDDLVRDGADRRGPILLRGALAALVLLALAAIGWRLDRTLHASLLTVTNGPVSAAQYAAGSILFGAGLLLAGLLALRRIGPDRGGARVLLLLAALEPVLLFGFPLLSAMRPPAPDRTLLTALNAEIGQDRMVTIGPLPPNVNAAYGLRSINHNGVPMPDSWIRRIRRDFGSGVDTLSFNGFSPFDRAGRPFLADALSRSPDRFAALGVGLLLAPHGFVPSGRGQDGVTDAAAGGELLQSGATLSVETTHWPAMVADRLRVRVGTFAGQSDGSLVVRACTDGTCVEGRGSVAATPDNAELEVRFAAPLPVGAGRTTRFTFQLADAANPLMIWFQRADWGRAPVLTLDDASRAPRLLFESRGGDLFRLPGAAPLFEADGCRVQRRDLNTVETDCAAPSILRRRELMLPGWRAEIGGAVVVPDTWDGLFQQVAVPAGHSTIRFRFAPPGASFAWAGFVLGVLLLAAGWRPAGVVRRGPA